jgi:subtilisin family serine protease
MAVRNKPLRARRNRSIEPLEPRVVMSADPLLGPPLTHHGGDFGGGMGHGFVETTPQRDPNAHFWIDNSALYDANDLGNRVEQTLAEAHANSGQAAMLAKYGFNGRGQTVAVIDSGIAFNHAALGTGIGGSSRIVGGWDFTENDGNFYDDGPSGSHGTHVAGIVGARGTTHSGVATGVDLVGLRVFDDAGNGYFTWVEQALRWVINNRTSFANPITAINLSLGTSWNALTVPSWSTLEDEFATLAGQGVFIAVSAGNAYGTYNSPGLSYPAASSNVVPVMSVDDNGQLSYFSQRASRAIAAPGRNIVSTAPDYAGSDGNTTDDDWVTMSGTSMAAPYVAGASALVREAMQFVGMTGITQTTIYNHLMTTADTFYDAASNANYQRLNVLRAIDSLMPADDFGSTPGTAFSLGTVADGGTAIDATRTGVVSTLADVDYFTFTAGSTGTATFTASGLTNSLTSRWIVGGAWNAAGNVCSVNVVAGQTYTVGFGTGAGLGRYTLTVDVTATGPQPATDWGVAAAQQLRTGINIGGERWYAVTAGRAGRFTVDAWAGAGTANVQVYDADRNLLSSPTAGWRADYTAAAGESLLIRVTGTATSANVRITNAVSQSGSTVTVLGSTGNDTIDFQAAARSVSLNGIIYTFDASATTFVIAGGGGNDTAILNGTAGNDVAASSVTGASTLSGAGYSASVTGATNVIFGAGTGGIDRITFADTAGNDIFTAGFNRAQHNGTGYSRDAWGFDETRFNGSTGFDRAVMYDTSSVDEFINYPTVAIMRGGGWNHQAWGVDASEGYSSGGNDWAVFFDSAGDDIYTGAPRNARMRGVGFAYDARGFFHSIVETSNVTDRAVFYDSPGNDVYVAAPGRAFIWGPGYSSDVWGPAWTTAISQAGGFDTATFNDSAGDDRFAAWDNRAVMWGLGFYHEARNFKQMTANATTGADYGTFHASVATHQWRWSPVTTARSGRGSVQIANGFDWAGGSETTPADVEAIDRVFALLAQWGV